MKDTQIMFRISPELKEKFQEICRKENETVSERLIYWIKKEVEEKTKIVN